MTLKPILFSTPMVQAILAGQKTQTRRVVKPQPEDTRAKGKLIDHIGDYCTGSPESGKAYYWHSGFGWNSSEALFPKAHKGDIFWVRETWQQDYHWTQGEGGYVFRADNPPKSMMLNEKWKPSIFMPKAACRLFLEVTDVRVERLQDISEADMIAEGIRVPVSEKGNAVLRLSGKNPPLHFLPDGALKDSYDGELTQYDFLKAEWAALWSDINGRESWDANPWVWVYTFKQIEKPENFN